MRIDGRTDRHNEGNRRCSRFYEKRLEQRLGEVDFNNQNYPLNARCDLNAELLNDESDDLDIHLRTRRSCRLKTLPFLIKRCLNVQSDCSNSDNF